ncbi:LAQU0S01e04654g1_1 [Lachancea quebecensis]|uniref:LAQU0S01e04654g1_1 n=1 Tax=Lachancea quebecensis TaxID=1654605 RepID=A0A0N7MKT2_9SACH|nr:LAQU0S01e04654g1_1 [Lachancea quebecensis]
MTLSLSSFVLVLSVVLMLLKNNKTFKQFLANKLQKSFSKLNRHIPISTNFHLNQSKNFEKSVGLAEVYDALLQLQEYGVRGFRQNAVLFHRASSLNAIHLEQLRKLNYFEKLEESNEAVNANQKTINSIIEHTLTQLLDSNSLDNADGRELLSVCNGLGYDYQENGVLKRRISHTKTLSPKSNQSRVNEAISHMCRDWHPKYEQERRPLMDFITSRLRSNRFQGRTLVVVPGSGAGGIAHEVALAFPEFDVHSVELSTLMYLCNEFALGHGHSISIKPFAQHFSGQLDTQNQVRDYQIDLSKVKRPSNLQVHLGDFCEFRPYEEYDQIIVASAYFIDTAENLFSYFDAIENLKFFCSELQWINVGPLKYGTQPKVQLNDKELTKLRKERNWKDLYHKCDSKDLNGYLTNEKSLYQGFYGLVKFHSTYKERK